MLTPDEIRSHDPGPWGGSLLRVTARTTSTNDDLKAASRRGAPSGTVLIAEEQTGGRGRLGRTWHSPPGLNLYLSILLRPQIGGLEDLPALALVAGLAVAEAIRGAAGLETSLKWPNDVLIEGRKVSGILAEATDARPPALVLGVGLNVNQPDFPAELDEIGTSLLRELGHEVDRAEMAAALLRRLYERMTQVETQGLGTVLGDWIALSSTIGRRIRTDDGREGRAVGVDQLGALLVTDDAGQTFRVIGGPIFPISRSPLPPRSVRE